MGNEKMIDSKWQRRWKVLDAKIGRMHEPFQQSGAPPNGFTETERANFDQLLTGLREFAREQFRFFYEGFGGVWQLDSNQASTIFNVAPEGDVDTLDISQLRGNGMQWPGKTALKEIGIVQSDSRGLLRLTEEEKFPPEFILRSTIDQISTDIATIETAILQRAHGEDTATLRLADKCGQYILQPVIGVLIPDTGIITYFHRSPVIRVMPYANVALIGIPITTPAITPDLLSIGHELGHYVYWHGAVDDIHLAAFLNPIVTLDFDNNLLSFEHEGVHQPQWHGKVNNHQKQIAAWMEEIFSDVFNCLMWRMPIAASAAIDNLQDNPLQHFTVDSGVYPVDAIRSFSCIQALSQLQPDQLGGTSTKNHGERDDLAAVFKWRVLNYSGSPKTITIGTGSEASSLPIEQAETLLRNEAGKIATLIFERMPIIKQSWEQRPKNLQQINELLFVDEATKNTIRDRIESIKVEWITEFEKFIDSIDERDLTTTSLEFSFNLKDWIRQRLHCYQYMTGEMPVEFWWPVFKAYGWAFEGPETYPWTT